MNRRKVSKTVKRRLTFLGPIFIAVFVICTITICTYMYKIETLKNQKQQLNTQLDNLKNKEEELSSEISKLKDPEYVARYAREKYMYSKDGELIIRIPDDDTDK